VLSALPGWRWARGLRWVPRPLRDGVYDVVARNRYRWFGRSETCLVPTPEFAARLLRE
jgi:predicted DCC family thiol-disulfide oxidoreductase YuxK